MNILKMQAEIWSIVSILVIFIISFILINSKRYRDQDEKQRKKTTVYTICRNGTPKDHNDQYINFIYDSYSFLLTEKSILAEFGFESEIRGNELLVDISNNGKRVYANLDS